MLARLKRKPDDGDKQGWLLIKEHDQAADTETDILAVRPESVKSGRRIEDLVAAASGETDRPQTRQVAGRGEGADAGKNRTAAGDNHRHAAAMAKDWLHEIKFDGYRTAAHLSDGKLSLITRSGLDWTKRYRDLESAFRKLPCTEAIIDGEIVVPDEKGVTRISALQDALSKGESHRLVYYAFDLLYLNGWNLTGVPLDRRKELLARLLDWPCFRPLRTATQRPCRRRRDGIV